MSWFKRPNKPPQPIVYHVRVGATRLIRYRGVEIRSHCWVCLDLPDPHLEPRECRLIVSARRPCWHWDGTTDWAVRC